MFNVCAAWGIYSEEESINPQGPFAICPACGRIHCFVQLPLFILTGASATDKSSVCLELAPRMSDCKAIEYDISTPKSPPQP